MMPLPVTSSRDSDSKKEEHAVVPPLFAGPLRDDLITCVGAAISAGDRDKAALLLQDADSAFPGDRVFHLLRLHYLKMAHRKAHCEAALQEAVDQLSEDRFVASLGKFREALLLSRGYELLERGVYDAGIAAAGERVGSHWRFAQELLHELMGVSAQPVVPSALLTSIERQKRVESIRIALDESGRAEHIEYLPHLRNRLDKLARTYPGDDGLETRLQLLDGILGQRFTEERDKNLRRLTLFRERLDLSGNPQTLRRFRHLVAPFVDAYPGDPAFSSVLEETRDLHLTYDNAARLIAENRLQEGLEICDRVLRQRPANVLFSALEEKAKAREWVLRLLSSGMQRARAFEQKAQYAEALEEWEAVREIDPRQRGLDAEILHCAALKQEAESAGSPQPASLDETALTPEVVYEDPQFDSPPMMLARPQPRAPSRRVRIAITREALNNLKTGVAATVALLLVVLIFATNARR